MEKPVIKWKWALTVFCLAVLSLRCSSEYGTVEYHYAIHKPGYHPGLGHWEYSTAN